VERPPLAIAAGMLLDVDDPVACIEVAAEAGFDALGLRFVQAEPTAGLLRRIRTALARTGLWLLDLEMSVLTRDGTPAPTDPQVFAVARELAPRHLTTVSYRHDPGRTAAHLAAACDAVGDAGVVPALEFLPFSGVRTFADARAVVAEVGADRAAVLVDALHVQRSGDVPESLAGSDAATIPYVQLCDAAARPADDSDAGLYREAVAGRVLPGRGGLPLERFLAALPPGTPLSVEVLSEELMQTLPPHERAVAAREATEALLERVATMETGA